MEVRQLGATRLTVTRIGLGLAALGRPSYITIGRDRDLGADRSAAAMERRSHEVLDAARAADIGYFDTARSYGLGEAFLASWLRHRDVLPGAVAIGSKWGYRYTAAWQPDADVHEVKDLSASHLEAQVHESLDILGPHLGLYQIHSATIESGVLDDRDVLTTLAGLRSEGLAIGLTVTGPRQSETIRRAMSVRVDGVELFQCVQATWNLLESSATPALCEAHAAGLGVIVKEVMANGRLAPGYEGRETAHLRDEASRRGVTLDVLATAAALAQPWVDVALTGAATVGQIRANVTAVDVATSLDDLDVTPMNAAESWGERGKMTWG